MQTEEKNIFHTASYRETGFAHLQQYRGCEDNVCTFVSPELTAAALSDGAGSCANAAKGSKITSSTALGMLSERFDELYAMTEQEFVNEMLQYIRIRLRVAAELHAYSYESLSATLLCAAIAADGRYLYFHIGDGVICACGRDGRCQVLSSYIHEIAPNYTTFVTVPETEYHYGKGKGDFSEFLLMSDGPEPFLTHDSQLTPSGKLMLLVSYFYPEEALVSELQKLTVMLKDYGMYDDASYAIIADARHAGEIFRHMSPEDCSLLFSGTDRIGMKQKKQIARMLELILFRSGISETELVREFHLHKKSHVRRKLSPFLNAGVLEFSNGRYFFK